MATFRVAVLGMGAVKLGAVLSRNSYVLSRWYRYGVAAWGRVMLRFCSVMPGVGVVTFSGVRVLYRKTLSWYCIACQSSVLVERCRVCAVMAQQSIGSYSAGNATSGRVMPGVGRVTHRSILRCVGLALLSYVKAQHGQVRSSTGTAKFGQVLVL